MTEEGELKLCSEASCRSVSYEFATGRSMPKERPPMPPPSDCDAEDAGRESYAAKGSEPDAPVFGRDCCCCFCCEACLAA